MRSSLCPRARLAQQLHTSLHTLISLVESRFFDVISGNRATVQLFADFSSFRIGLYPPFFICFLSKDLHTCTKPLNLSKKARRDKGFAGVQVSVQVPCNSTSVAHFKETPHFHHPPEQRSTRDCTLTTLQRQPCPPQGVLALFARAMRGSDRRR